MSILLQLPFPELLEHGVVAQGLLPPEQQESGLSKGQCATGELEDGYSVIRLLS